MNYLVLKDKKNEVVRVFDWKTSKAFLVYCKDKRRLDLLPQADFLREKDSSMILVKELSQSQFKKPMVLSSGFCLEMVESSRMRVQSSAPLEIFGLQNFWKIAGGVTGVFILFISGLLFFHEPSERDNKIQPLVVKIVKPPSVPEKLRIKSYQLHTKSSETKSVSQKKVLKRSLKKMSALGALRSLSHRERVQQAGLNLTNSKVSQAPGIRATATDSGSGGVQSAIYSKGLMTVALGSGGNVKGGGGYETKGGLQGGGQAGYGQLNLVGSVGNLDLSGSSSDKGGEEGFNPTVIHKAIQRKTGEIRLCYDEALRADPGLKGIFSVDLSIDQRGLVRHSKVHSESEIQSRRVSRCILNVLNTVKFNMSSNQETIHVIYKFDLMALRGGD